MNMKKRIDGRNVIDCSAMPVMKAKCKTCPFGPNGDPELRAMVTSRLLQVSQSCHSTGLVRGKPDTHICRGARDVQNDLMFKLGIIEAPTDEAWEKKRNELGI